MEEVDIVIKKIISLGSIKSIVCNDCKEYHHISKEFFKITGVSNKHLDLMVNGIEKRFRSCHNNHDIETKDICPFPSNYKLFLITFQYYTRTEFHTGDDWDIDDSEFDELDDFIWGDLTDSKNKKDKGGE